jgi:ribosomal protein S21
MARIVRNKIEAELVATGKTEDQMESVDSMLRRFKKQVMNQEILLDVRKHEFFIKKNKRLKEKSKLARIKNKLFRDR